MARKNTSTPYAVAVYVGAKYGGWIVGGSRFKSAYAANADIEDVAARERHANATCMLRRVVEVPT